MRKIRIAAAIAAIATLSPLLAQAHANMPRVDRREASQERRIEQGVASGSLTPREARRLERGQRHVANMEARAKADGVVTHRERAELRHAQDVQSRRIYAEKHDAQHDYNHNGRLDRPHRR